MLGTGISQSTNPGGSINPGLIQFASNKQLDEREDDARKSLREAQEQQNQPAILNLASHLRTLWQSAKDGKMEIDQRLLKCLRQRNGEYEPEMAAQIKAHGGSDIYMMLTSMKCRAAEAWFKDIELPPGEKPWGIDPTPEPDLPEDVQDKIDALVQFETYQLMLEAESIEAVDVNQVKKRIQELKDGIFKEQLQEAKQATFRIERRIEDDLVQGGYYKAINGFINDLCTFPTGFVGGPFIKKDKSLAWVRDEDGAHPQVTDKLKRTYRRISPFNLYPSKGAQTLQDGYLFEILRFRRADIQKLRGVPGYKTESIDAVLTEYGQGGLREWMWYDQEKAEAEGKPHKFTDPEPMIDALLFWGNIQGSKLQEWDKEKYKDLKATDDYQITAMLIGNYVVMARLNPHPLGRRPYYSASYEEVTDSIWGKALPELMEDIQRICNAAARSTINNMAIASGPQVEVHADRLMPGEDVTDIYPWKITKTKSDESGRADNPAIYFYQPNDNTDKLLKVYQYFFDQASEVTGIPQYFQGSQQISGAGKTASGLAMLMNAASKTLKGVVFHIDLGIIVPTIEEHYLHVMLYDDDIEKTGDINVMARASDYLIMQEQLQVRRTEFLEMTNNPTDLQIMGLKGRAGVLREQVKGLKLPSEDIIPPKEAFEPQPEEQGAGGLPPGVPPPEVIAAMQGQGMHGQGIRQPMNLLPGGQQAGTVQ